MRRIRTALAVLYLASGARRFLSAGRPAPTEGHPLPRGVNVTQTRGCHPGLGSKAAPPMSPTQPRVTHRYGAPIGTLQAIFPAEHCHTDPDTRVQLGRPYGHWSRSAA